MLGYMDGSQVACRSLGYSTGVQIIVGRTSALPGPAGVTDSVLGYACRGDEASLEDCEVEVTRITAYFADAEYDDGSAVAIICSNADSEGMQSVNVSNACMHVVHDAYVISAVGPTWILQMSGGM